jgi:formamidopyrimidine-DNA glycosylase
MPELPDVAALQDYMEQTALNQQIVRTSVPDRRILEDITPSGLGRHLTGQTIAGTYRQGKYLFGEVPERGWLMMHFGMTGELAYYKREGDAPDFSRVILDFASGFSLAYISRRMLGRVAFTHDFKQYLESRKVGPDALSPTFTVERLAESLAGRKAQVKSLLMDQSVVAGIGNMYADEVLFQAGLHPKTRALALDPDDITRLHRVLRRVLETAVRHHAKVHELPNRYLLRHRTPEGRCPACGNKLVKTQVSRRTTYFCPACQKQSAKE